MKTSLSPARRIARALFAATCLFGTVAVATGQTALAAGGSQDSVAYQINPTHSGRINFANGFSAPLRQLWSANLGGAVSYPLTAAGMAFVTVGLNNSALLEALSLSTGAVVWEKLLPGSTAWADAVYDNGTVFVINSVGQLLAFRAVSGKKLWSVQLSGYQYNTAYGAPAARNGLLVVQYQTQNASGAVAAFDEKTGASRWSSSLGSNASTGIGGVAAISANGIFVGDSVNFYELSPADGSAVWSTAASCGPSDAPVLTRASVFVARSGYYCNNNNTIYNAVNGTATGYFSGSNAPVVQNRKDIVISLNGVLYSYSPKSDNVNWTFAGDNYMNYKPVVINGYVAALSSYGKLYLIDGSTGSEYWSTSLNYSGNNYGGPDWGLGAGEGALLVPYGSYLYAFVPQNGKH